MGIPGFTAGSAVGRGGAYRGGVSYAGGWAVARVRPQQDFCSPSCSDVPGAIQRCCIDFPGSGLHCWTQPAPPCTPCGQLRGCARDYCECTLAGGTYIHIPFWSQCGFCLPHFVFFPDRGGLTGDADTRRSAS